MKIFPIGTSRLHEPLSLISESVNFPGFGYFHSPSQIKDALEFISGSKDLSVEESRFFFRRDQTPENIFNNCLWVNSTARKSMIETIRDKFLNSDVLVMEISSFKTFLLNGIAVQGNPNYYHNIPYSEIWNKSYYKEFHPDFFSCQIDDEENINQFFDFLSRFSSDFSKKIILLGHLVDPNKPNKVRADLNKALKNHSSLLSNIFFLDTEALVAQYGFRVLDDGRVDIHHLPWDALDELSKSILKASQENFAISHVNIIKEKAYAINSVPFFEKDFCFSLNQLPKLDEIEDLSCFLGVFLKIDLVKKIKDDSRLDGFWAFQKIMLDLENRAGNIPEYFFNSLESDTELYNFSYIFPKIFCRSDFCNSEYYINLDFVSFTSLLTRGEHFYKVLEFFGKKPDEWLGDVHKIANLSFKCTAESKGDNEKEKVFLNRILSKFRGKDQGSNDKNFLPLLENRYTLINEKNKEPLSSDRVCLLLCGQLRGFKKSAESISKAFVKPSNVDVFVSTWNDVGRGPVSPERLVRFYENDAFEYLKSKYSDEEALEITENLIFNRGAELHDGNENILRSIFSEFNSFKYNSFDDQAYPFNKMNNSEKMYFHNSFWIETLGHGFFRKYDRVIKIRPDLKLSEGKFFDDIKMLENTVYVENYGGWIYRDWGFGIGDQIIAGGANEMLKVLDLHGQEKQTTVFNKFLSNTPYGYSGHRNCGVATWLNGYDCTVSEVRPVSICNIDNFTLNDLKELEEK